MVRCRLRAHPPPTTRRSPPRGVTFSNGTVGDLQASSKVNNKGQFTTCSYYSAGEYLGYFQSAEFASSDADAVLQFCLDNYANRDVH